MAEQVAVSSRRGVLAAGVAALAAVAAQALGRPLRARAADGETVVTGGEYTSSSPTKIDNTSGLAGDAALYGVCDTGVGVLGHTQTNNAVQGVATTSGTGVSGYSQQGIGVWGSTNSPTTKPAIAGYSPGNTGVIGFSGTGSLPATPTKTGVYGEANQDANSVGVHGKTVAGYGVWGESQSGFGLYGITFTGAAVKADAAANDGIAVDATGIGPRPVIRAMSLGAANAIEASTNNSVAPAAIVGKAYGSTGVYGSSAQGATPAPPTWTGVYGVATEGAAARGVRGDTLSGRGVHGQATAGRGIHGQATTGIGVYATAAAGGTALQAAGQVRFSTSGLGTIARGTRSRTITPGVDITASSKVFVTLQSSPGGTISVQRVARDAVNNRFTVYLTANAAANTVFAWFVIS
jgi:hypothetical protein